MSCKSDVLFDLRRGHHWLTLRGGGVTGTKGVQNLTLSRNPVTPTEGGHRSRNQSCSKFRKDSKSGDFPRDPKIKNVGNLLKRVDPQTKLVYGDGKGLKNTKNYKASNLPMNCKGLGKSPSKLSDNKFRGTCAKRLYFHFRSKI